MFMINKGYRLLTLLLIATLFALVGCNSTADKNFEEAIIGPWLDQGSTIHYGSSIASADSSLESPATTDPSIQTFNADGTVTSVWKGIKSQYKYTLDGDVFTMITTNNGKTDSTLGVVNITGDIMTITYHFEQATSPWGVEAWLVNKYIKQ